MKKLLILFLMAFLNFTHAEAKNLEHYLAESISTNKQLKFDIAQKIRASIGGEKVDDVKMDTQSIQCLATTSDARSRLFGGGVCIMMVDAQQTNSSNVNSRHHIEAKIVVVSTPVGYQTVVISGQ